MLNGATRAALDALPVPWDGGPARACVVLLADRWALAWQFGTTKEPSGVTFGNPKDAVRAASYINERNGE